MNQCDLQYYPVSGSLLKSNKNCELWRLGQAPFSYEFPCYIELTLFYLDYYQQPSSTKRTLPISPRNNPTYENLGLCGSGTKRVNTRRKWLNDWIKEGRPNKAASLPPSLGVLLRGWTGGLTEYTEGFHSIVPTDYPVDIDHEVTNDAFFMVDMKDQNSQNSQYKALINTHDGIIIVLCDNMSDIISEDYPQELRNHNKWADFTMYFWNDAFQKSKGKSWYEPLGSVSRIYWMNISDSEISSQLEAIATVAGDFPSAFKETNWTVPTKFFEQQMPFYAILGTKIGERVSALLETFPEYFPIMFLKLTIFAQHHKDSNSYTWQMVIDFEGDGVFEKFGSKKDPPDAVCYETGPWPWPPNECDDSE